ncbi:hypothetical protein J3458_004631 [Metarhizium acridum]|uniref:uncharacterized protein n=1 Tax=Metarhizium acridum TaxID=92637 RepID=UPI001C6D24B9|nr:hypothetical protein J3458_004631 [Metarhizium acridum]
MKPFLFFSFFLSGHGRGNVLYCLLHADASVADAGSSFAWKFWGDELWALAFGWQPRSRRQEWHLLFAMTMTHTRRDNTDWKRFALMDQMTNRQYSLARQRALGNIGNSRRLNGCVGWIGSS